jgi:isochorismate synthase
MRVDSDGCSLYAGGGLLADSKMETEWMETEYKLGTMRALLNKE